MLKVKKEKNVTATNHVLAGALLGSVLPLPVALPVAFMSHFVMDKIPHFGTEESQRNHSTFYKSVVFADIAIAITLALVAIHLHKWVMLAAGFAAYSPDSTLVFYYLTHGHDFNIQPRNGFMKFHLAMQYERPWGIIPEAAVALALLPFVIIQFSK